MLFRSTKNKFDIGDLFTNGENHRDKIPLGDFKVITLENSLLSQQAVISKEIPVPYIDRPKNELTHCD